MGPATEDSIGNATLGHRFGGPSHQVEARYDRDKPVSVARLSPPSLFFTHSHVTAVTSGEALIDSIATLIASARQNARFRVGTPAITAEGTPPIPLAHPALLAPYARALLGACHRRHQRGARTFAATGSSRATSWLALLAVAGRGLSVLGAPLPTTLPASTTTSIDFAAQVRSMHHVNHTLCIY